MRKYVLNLCQSQTRKNSVGTIYRHLEEKLNKFVVDYDFLFIYMKLKNLEKKTSQLHFKLHIQKKKTQEGTQYCFIK